VRGVTQRLRALRAICPLRAFCALRSRTTPDCETAPVRRRSRRLSGQILAFQLLILVGTLALGFVLALVGTQSRLDDQYEERALLVARSVAATPEIARAVARGDADGSVQRRAEAIRRSTGTTFVVVTDARGIRVSHPDPRRIGQRVSTDPSEALRGGTVLAVEDGTLGRSARAKVPLREGGRIVGAVSVGIHVRALNRELRTLVPVLALYLSGALVLGVGASLLLARRLKRQTFGLELDELTGLVQEHEAMLHGIREGVVVIDPAGRLRLVNDQATRLTGLTRADVGRRVRDVAGGTPLGALLDGESPGTDELLVHGDRVVVANRMAVRRDGRDLGAVATLRDRTELDDLVRELDSVRGLTDALRAQAHEFAGRLHTIAGLLALGHPEDARAFIAEIADADVGLRHEIAERIGEPRVAALLLAKATIAGERGVGLELAPESALDGELRDPREVLTIVGNLVDNAIDAAAGRPGARVVVGLAVEADALVAWVRDTGPGVAEADREAVFSPGWSTKAAQGRGVGLSLVRQLVARRGGDVAVEDAEDGQPGAVFTAWVPGAVLDDGPRAAPIGVRADPAVDRDDRSSGSGVDRDGATAPGGPASRPGERP
jgi:two-component system CitB family sensor kinase